MEIISNSSDLSVWNLIKSRCPTPEINESRIKIGRTLIQENEVSFNSIFIFFLLILLNFLTYFFIFLVSS